MPTRNGQFQYPEGGWSTGKMAKAGPRGLDSGREFRELEGERKRRETKVSSLAEGTEMPGAGWDDMHYSELERQIGADNMQFIRKMDERVLGDTYFTEPHEGKGSKGFENWKKMRQQWIDMFNRPDSGVVTHPEKGIAGPGPMGGTKWETG